ILLSLSNDDIELAQNTYLEAIEYEESEISELVIDLTNPTVSQKIKSYQEINNTYISMKEILDDNQIIETQDDPDDLDDEPPKISAYEALNSQTMPLNVKYSLNEMDFSYNNRFSGDDYDFLSDDFPDNNFLDNDFLDNDFPCNDDFSDDNNFSDFPDNYNSSDNYEN
ncbi:16532_t:CDS:2, partial [Cetraspora pellucida]